MNVSLNWLTDYVDVAMPAGQLAELLTRIGLSVEEVRETNTDVVMDVEVTSNRPDCLGHLGVAREVAAALGTAFRPPVIGELPTAGKVADFTSVEVRDPELCPRYTARVIRGVKVAASPRWMVERLEAVGLRSINNIVDATNYVLMEYSQPLHSFDYDKLAGHKIIVRRALGGETLVSIDQTECRLDEQMLVIADAQRAVAIAGIMGGLDTEVTEGTTNVLIEAAQFDPLTTRRTSRKLQLMSESNYRFERGVDVVGLDEASRRACQLILQVAGGKLAEGVADVWAEPWRPRNVTLRPGRCDALLGVKTPVEQQADILARLGLRPHVTAGAIECTVPPHRGDISREADLIEEVARMVGYDRIPVHGSICHRVEGEELTQRARRHVAQAMTAAGFDEAVTNSFVDDGEARRFGWRNCLRVDSNVRKSNNVLRPTLIPSLLRACKNNQDAGNAEVSLFEIAAVFPPAAGHGLPEEHVELAAVTTRELRDLRGALEAVAERIAAGLLVEVAPKDHAGLASAMAGEVLIGGEPAGWLGMVSPETLDACGLSPARPLAATWVRFEALLGRAGRQRTHTALPKFPAVKRDLSVIVDEDVTWGRLAAVIGAVKQPTRVGLDYVTTYRGKQVPAGRKAVTLTLTYRSPDATLRSEDVDAGVEEILGEMRKDLRAELRS